MQPSHELRSLNQWQLIHTYDLLVDRGMARAVECPDCGTRMVPRIKGDVDDGPWMWCCTCNAYSKPGSNFWNQITPVVKEHYDVSVHFE